MIRRWSRIETTQFDCVNYPVLSFKFNFKSFRKAIIFKKFFTLYSKILRKHYSRMKHTYNWILYTQVWQHWISDFFKIKNIIKYFYFKNFQPIEYFSYDPYRFNTKQQKLFHTTPFLNCGLPKSLYLWSKFCKKHPANFEFEKTLVPNISPHFSYAPSSTSLSNLDKNLPLLVFSVLNGIIFTPTTIKNLTNLKFNLVYIFDEIFLTCLNLIKELYKINTLIVLSLIFK